MSCQPRWCVRAIRFVAVSAIVLLPVALMLLLGLAWNRACAQAQPGTGGKGDYYPLRPGARWDYRVKVGDEVQGAISEVVATIETINNVPLVRLETQVKGKTVSSEHLRVTKDGVYRHRIGGIEMKVPVPVLRYPVKANDSWEQTTMVGQQTIKGKVTTRFEEVEVPLGKFKAFVTDIKAEAEGKPIHSTIWFAEGVGKIKQTLDLGGVQVTLELEKFTPGKVQP
jgi:hypothetical protein